MATSSNGEPVTADEAYAVVPGQHARSRGACWRPDRDIPAYALRAGHVVEHDGQICTVLVSRPVALRPYMYSVLSNGRAGEVPWHQPIGIYGNQPDLNIAAIGKPVSYGWLVEPDELMDGEGIELVFGPDTISHEMRVRLSRGEGTRFRMGEHDAVYVTGRFLGPASQRYSPLVDYGHAWAGATWIEYSAGGGRWVRVAGPRSATWRGQRSRIRCWLSQIWPARARRRRQMPEIAGDTAAGSD